jgi:uncharacterized protein (DUF1330 family)
MKKGYWISLYTKIENQENLKKYAEVVTPIIKSFGGVPLVRGGSIFHMMEMILSDQLFGNFQVMKKLLNVTIQKNI